MKTLLTEAEEMAEPDSEGYSQDAEPKETCLEIGNIHIKAGKGEEDPRVEVHLHRPKEVQPEEDPEILYGNASKRQKTEETTLRFNILTDTSNKLASSSDPKLNSDAFLVKTT